MGCVFGGLHGFCCFFLVSFDRLFGTCVLVLAFSTYQSIRGKRSVGRIFAQRNHPTSSRALWKVCVTACPNSRRSSGKTFSEQRCPAIQLPNVWPTGGIGIAKCRCMSGSSSQKIIDSHSPVRHLLLFGRTRPRRQRARPRRHRARP